MNRCILACWLLLCPAVVLADVAVNVTLSSAAAGEFSVALVGSGDVTLTLPAGFQWDWCKPGGVDGTIATPTVPDLKIPNNDGVQSPSVTLTAPVSTTCDVDPNDHVTGFTATVAGVSKPLVLANGVWSATFMTAPAPPVLTGGANLSWVSPTLNTDGTPILLSLRGFNVYWGTSQGNYPNSTSIADPTVRTYALTGLAAGTWYFVATAVSTNGESAYSNVASKTIQGATPTDPCVTSPLALPTLLKWPSAHSGSRSLSWSSPAAIVGLAYGWPLGQKQTATWTDDRGCAVSASK